MKFWLNIFTMLIFEIFLRLTSHLNSFELQIHYQRFYIYKRCYWILSRKRQGRVSNVARSKEGVSSGSRFWRRWTSIKVSWLLLRLFIKKKHQLRFRSMGISQKALICNEGTGRDAPYHLLCMWCTLNPSLLISLVRVVLWASNCHIGSPRFLLTQTIFLLFCRDQKDVNCIFLLLNILRSSSVWKLSLQNHSCYIPSESSRHQEAKNHHIFCVASNDATLWVKIKLTLFALFELWSLELFLKMLHVIKPFRKTPWPALIRFKVR